MILGTIGTVLIVIAAVALTAAVLLLLEARDTGGHAVPYEPGSREWIRRMNLDEEQQPATAGAVERKAIADDPER
jgi:hypothetical protein